MSLLTAFRGENFPNPPCSRACTCASRRLLAILGEQLCHQAFERKNASAQHCRELRTLRRVCGHHSEGDVALTTGHSRPVVRRRSKMDVHGRNVSFQKAQPATRDLSTESGLLVGRRLDGCSGRGFWRCTGRLGSALLPHREHKRAQVGNAWPTASVRTTRSRQSFSVHGAPPRQAPSHAEREQCPRREKALLCVLERRAWTERTRAPGGSGHDLRVLGSSPESGSLPHRGSAAASVPPPTCSLNLSLSNNK